MSRCELTGKKARVKNLVSHSNIKTKKKAFPNVHQKRIFSQALKRLVGLKIASSTIRALEHIGGFDTFILNQPDEVLSRRALTVKNQIKRRLVKKSSSQGAKK